MYNDVMTYVKEYIDSHPDTQLLSAADHECGGLTLEDNYDPTVLQRSNSTTEALGSLMESYEGDDKADYLKNELLPAYGVLNATDEDVQTVLKAGEDGVAAMGIAAGHLLAAAAGVHWSTEGHTAVDVLLHGYASEGALAAMKATMGKNNDNTELALYIEQVLGLNLQNATATLQSHGSDWIGRRDEFHIIKRENSLNGHRHG